MSVCLCVCRNACRHCVFVTVHACLCCSCICLFHVDVIFFSGEESSLLSLALPLALPLVLSLVLSLSLSLALSPTLFLVLSLALSLAMSWGSSPACGPALCRLAVRSCTLKLSLVRSCLFSWPTDGGDTRDADPPTHRLVPAGHLDYRTHSGQQPPDPLTRGYLLQGHPLRRLFLLASSVLGPGSCHQCH